MQKISIKDVAFSGYRLLAKKPGIAATWFVFQLVVGLVLTTWTISAIGPQLAAMQEIRAAGPAGDYATMGALGRQTLPFQMLLLVVNFIITAVTVGAASRAVFRPQESRLGYLRFGKDELRLLVVNLVVGIILMLTLLVAYVPYVAVLVAGVRTGGPAAIAQSMAKAAPWVIPGLLLFVFVAVKLSLAGAQTVGERAISIFGSWTLTKGNFWRLLAGYLLALVPLIVLIALAAVATKALSGGDFSGGIGKLAASLQPQAATVSELFTPASLLRLVFSAILGAVGMAAFFVTAATACAQLSPAPEAAFDDEDDD